MFPYLHINAKNIKNKYGSFAESGLKIPEVEPSHESTSETLFEFKEKEAKGKWIVISENEKNVEGKLYECEGENNNNELVVFLPGLPGDGVTWFENDHVPLLLEKGYSVFVGRHSGLVYKEQNADLINSGERIDIAESENTEDAEALWSDWMNEGDIILPHFSSKYKKIDIVSHSFGSLPALNALSKLGKENSQESNEISKKIDRLIILSGLTYDLKKDGTLDTERNFNISVIRDFLVDMKNRNVYNLGNIEENFQNCVDSYNELNSHITDVPDNISVIGIYPEEDRTLSIKAGLDLQNKLGRGVIIDDKTFRQELHGETDAHDFPHLLPENMLRFLQMNVPPQSKHKVMVSNPFSSDKK